MFDILKIKQETRQSDNFKYCTEFIVHGWARPSTKEVFMFDYHDTKNVLSDTQECQDYLGAHGHLWEDLDLDGLAWFCHHVTVSFHKDYLGEVDAEVDTKVICQKKCKNFTELKYTWLDIKNKLRRKLI